MSNCDLYIIFRDDNFKLYTNIIKSFYCVYPASYQIWFKVSRPSFCCKASYVSTSIFDIVCNSRKVITWWYWYIFAQEEQKRFCWVNLTLNCNAWNNQFIIIWLYCNIVEHSFDLVECWGQIKIYFISLYDW